ncbi:hypothetical protein MUK42_00876 [Musa troglodytarum]|uniref:Uncharacterized protein n=1 Tax=Musa troglodytarum TaxID=320322 RepID=A0A9E7GPJ6_9LILI|nr:hypothetical protein MUK42_00876 [Musa troglodytarum]
MCALLVDISVMPLFVGHLLNHYHHRSSTVEAKENATIAFLNLSISVREMLMCVLDALIATLHILSLVVVQHVVATLYNLISIEVYHFSIGSKKPLIATLMNLLGVPDVSTRSIKDVLKALFGLVSDNFKINIDYSMLQTPLRDN